MGWRTFLNKYLPDNRFEYAVNVVLEHEGYFSNDKRDPGGVTKYGVNLRFLQAANIHIIDHQEIDVKDIMALTKEDAKNIYNIYYWHKYQIYEINNLIVATKVFDMSVNMGGFQAIKLLQRAINMLNLNKIEVDGAMGIHTLYSANSCNPSQLHNELKEVQEKFYKDLVTEKPTLECFLNGWLNRSAW